MRVTMISRYAGPGGVWQPGAVVDLAEAEAKDLIAGGFATAAEPAKVEEATAPAAPEKAVSKRARKPAAKKQAAKRPAQRKGGNDG